MATLLEHVKQVKEAAHIDDIHPLELITGPTLTQGSFIRRVSMLGFAGGLRSQVPFASMALAASRGDFPGRNAGIIGAYKRKDVQLAAGASSLGEMVVDKLPFVPSRLEPASLAGRFVFGGLAGAIYARGYGRSLVTGAVLGAATAGLGAYAGYHARRAIGEQTGFPDPVVAVGEDVIAITLGQLAVRK